MPACAVCSEATSVTNPPILIAGAGPVGLTAALALHQRGHAVRVIDTRPAAAAHTDPRAIALAVALTHGSRLILERLGVWQRVAATPIAHIHVSQQGGFGQTRIEAADHQLDALGYVARLGALTTTLRETALDAGIAVDAAHQLRDCAGTANGLIATIQSAAGEQACATPLLLIAEGRPPPGAARKDYGQTAIVTEAWSDQPHDRRAFERFTAAGPLALLPLERGYSIVWCMRDDQARVLLALDDSAFRSHLAHATAFAQRTWSRVGARAAFPLALVQAAAAAHPRSLALGNAAQTLHPVAGQGLNLGLRDAFELAQALERGVTDAALARFAAQRARDRTATIALTDQTVSLFSNHLAPLRVARGAGLALFNLLPPLRRAMARRMMFGAR